jgi:hypothetical protein
MRPPVVSSRAKSLAPDLHRALLVSAAVGSALVVLNQGDVLASALGGGAPLPSTLSWKVPLTYLVPFLVSLGSSRATRRALRPRRDVSAPRVDSKSRISRRAE